MAAAVDVCLMKTNSLVPDDRAAFTEMVAGLVWLQGSYNKGWGSNPENAFFPEDPMTLRIGA